MMMVYEKFSIQPYLRSPCFTNNMVNILFNMRSSMTRDIRSNFSSMYGQNLSCPLKCDAVDSQSHLLVCPVLLAELDSSEEETARSVHYNDIYGSLEQQREVVLVLMRLLDIREKLIKKEEDNCLPVGGTGPNSIVT